MIDRHFSVAVFHTLQNNEGIVSDSAWLAERRLIYRFTLRTTLLIVRSELCNHETPSSHQPWPVLHRCNLWQHQSSAVILHPPEFNGSFVLSTASWKNTPVLAWWCYTHWSGPMHILVVDRDGPDILVCRISRTRYCYPALAGYWIVLSGRQGWCDLVAYK